MCSDTISFRQEWTLTCKSNLMLPPTPFSSALSSPTPCVFSPRLLRVALCAQVGDNEHKEPAVFLMQTALNLSYLLAKTDGVGTKRLTAKNRGEKKSKKEICNNFFFSLVRAHSTKSRRGVGRKKTQKTGRSKKQHSPVARYCLEVSKFKLTMRLGEVAS